MPLSFINSSDSGTTAKASASSWNCAAIASDGNTVALAIATAAGTGVTAVSGLGASWSAVSKAQKGTNASAHVEWWVGTGCVSGDQAITITTNAGATWVAMAYEVSGVSSWASGGTNNAATTNPTITVSGLAAAGYFVAAALAYAFTTASAPGGSWTDYNSGGFARSVSRDAAQQITTVSSNQTATWTESSASNWGIAAVVLEPSADMGSFLPLL